MNVTQSQRAFDGRGTDDRGDYRSDRLRPGDLLANRYRCMWPIGKGAFGAVFLTEDLMIKEEIILKSSNLLLASDDGIIKRYCLRVVVRAQDYASQRHPHIRYDQVRKGVRHIHGILPESHAWRAACARKPMTMHQALPVIRNVCMVTEAAHQAGAIYRDLKPNKNLIDN